MTEPVENLHDSLTTVIDDVESRHFNFQKADVGHQQAREVYLDSLNNRDQKKRDLHATVKALETVLKQIKRIR